MQTNRTNATFRGSQKGGFQKGGFGGCSLVPKTGTKVHLGERQSIALKGVRAIDAQNSQL